jgi:hypothetical protein
VDTAMRPWITQELGQYMQRGEDMVQEMNRLFTGKDADAAKIIAKIEELEALALETVKGKTQYPQRDYTLPTKPKESWFRKRRTTPAEKIVLQRVA